MLKVQSSQFILPKAADVSGDDACDFSINDTLLIAVLCDGVGGAIRGGQAARQTVKYIIDQFQKRPKTWDVPRSITVFTEHINRLLFKESMTQYERTEFLTTLCIAVVEGKTLYTMNLGDSRIYLQKDNGSLWQLSDDHVMDEENLSHVLTQACGLSEHSKPIVKRWDIAVGDRLILCSDGISNLIDDAPLVKKINKGLSAKLIVNSVTEGHKDHNRDDASLQIFQFKQFDELFEIRNKALPIPESLKEGDTFDGYRLSEPMMSHKRIWKATKDDSVVVIKFPMSTDDQAIDEFVHEAWYAKQISHKSFGHAWVPEERTSRYYLMELIEGKNLMEFLKEKHLSVDNAISLAKFLYKAEAHLLHLGLVHGDIKPENIIVYRDKDSAGTSFKMVDFGSIVKIFSENSRAGTPTYLAPERFTGAAINEATEIFSIGVTIYWALSGKYPYGEIEPFQTPKFKQAKALNTYNKNIPKWFDSVIMRAIAIDPNQRYSHYSEFFYELKTPENVKPYFAKNTPLIEREPILFYKIAFILMFLLEIVTLVAFLS